MPWIIFVGLRDLRVESVEVFGSLPQERDQINLYFRVSRQSRGLNRGARRGGGREIGAVHLVHRGEIGHVRQVDRRFHDLLERGPCGGQDGAEILEDAVRLFGHAAADQRTGCRIEGDLAGEKQEVTGPDGLGVGPDRLRRLRRGNGRCHGHAARSGGLGDLVGPDAPGADPDATNAAADHRADGLQIWLEPASGNVIRVTVDPAVDRFLAANFALFGHGASYRRGNGPRWNIEV